MVTAHHEVRTIFKTDLLRIVDYRCAGGEGQSRREEWPAAHEIAILRSGAYVRRDALGTAVADPTQILFFNQGQPYEVQHPVPGGDCSTVFLLSPTMLGEITGSCGEMVERPFRRSHAALGTALRWWQHHLLATVARGIPVDPVAVEERVLEMLGRLIKALHAADRRAGATPSGDRVELANAVRLVLNARYRKPLHLSEIAAAVYCSPYHLCRVFKQATGHTIHQTLIRLRLEEAITRIAEAPAEPLDRIALDCGFSNHSHLSTVFRRVLGVSPSDFRQAVTDRGLLAANDIREDLQVALET